MNFDAKEWVKMSLMESERRRCISKVLSIESNESVPIGNNYASDIFRLKIKVVTGSGEFQERTVIYKILPVTADKFPGINELGIFKAEAKIYSGTLHEMEKLLKAKDPGSEPLWPMFYGVQGNYEGLLMEDLTGKGYIMGDRRKGLDFDHSRFTLKNLAKFHALAAVLIDNGTIQKNNFSGINFFFREEGIYAQKSLQSLDFLIQAIQDKWPSHWKEFIPRISKFKNSRMFVEKVLEKANENNNIFKTLNHGDVWVTNIFFQYDYDGLPKSLRFIDYQIPSFHSPCYDLHYFFSTSLRLEFMTRKRDLLKVYHESLVFFLKLYGFSKTIPTFEELQNDFENTVPFGFFIALTSRPTMMNPPIHELVKKYNIRKPEDMFSCTLLYDGEDFLKMMKHTLMEMMEYGLL